MIVIVVRSIRVMKLQIIVVFMIYHMQIIVCCWLISAFAHDLWHVIYAKLNFPITLCAETVPRRLWTLNFVVRFTLCFLANIVPYNYIMNASFKSWKSSNLVLWLIWTWIVHCEKHLWASLRIPIVSRYSSKDIISACINMSIDL